MLNIGLKIKTGMKLIRRNREYGQAVIFRLDYTPKIESKAVNQ